MPTKNYTIKTMDRKEVDIAIEWAAKEGWNPGLHDAECYYTADPTGFLIGFLDEEPIATISAINYCKSFGFLGFYIVRPEYRGKGYGIQIWNAGLKYLKGRNIGLDGVVAQQDNYKKSGFKPAYSNIRYEGHGGGVPPENADIVNLSTLPFETIAGGSTANVLEISSFSFSQRTSLSPRIFSDSLSLALSIISMSGTPPETAPTTQRR
jgi:GNAT superfamily N-acetyltransferase